MQQYFVEEVIDSNASIFILHDSQLQHHLIKVLRMHENEQCLLVDQAANTFLATLKSTDEEITFEISLKEDVIDVEFPVEPVIACSLSKKDKLEWIAQKSTELGAKRILFFNSKYSVKKWDSKIAAKKISRMQEIIKNAAQQSHRQMIPQVEYLESLSELIKKTAEYSVKLVAYEEVAKAGQPSNLVSAINQIETNQKVICLFGPEGGFDESEIKLLNENGFLSVGLGPRILRAETAPLYFLSTLSYKFDLM